MQCGHILLLKLFTSFITSLKVPVCFIIIHGLLVFDDCCNTESILMEKLDWLHCGPILLLVIRGKLARMRDISASLNHRSNISEETTLWNEALKSRSGSLCQFGWRLWARWLLMAVLARQNLTPDHFSTLCFCRLLCRAPRRVRMVFHKDHHIKTARFLWLEIFTIPFFGH